MMKLFQDSLRNTLSYSDSGDPRGFPVLIQHGLIASVKDAHLFSRLADAGARLISIARPGYGDSSSCVLPNIGAWADLIAPLIAELGLERFDVFGISSGAPYSYAIAHKFPDQVRNVFILSGIPALYDSEVVADWPHPVQTDANLAEMQALAHELWFSHLSPEDLQKDDIQDSLRNNCFGIGQDLQIRGQDWGFTLSDVRAPVMMRHSRHDNPAPVEITARLLPDCRLDLSDNPDHFSQAVLDDFITTVMAGHYA
jgi:pimeloyl-ACP methyl ester carboxylesterase